MATNLCENNKKKVIIMKMQQLYINNTGCIEFTCSLLIRLNYYSLTNQLGVALALLLIRNAADGF